MRVARGASRAAVFLAAVLARAAPRADFTAVLDFRGRRALVALLVAFAAGPGLPTLLALPALLARARATALFFRAALFLGVFRARDFARVAPFFLVAAALRLAIALVLSAPGLP